MSKEITVLDGLFQELRYMEADYEFPNTRTNKQKLSQRDPNSPQLGSLYTFVMDQLDTRIWQEVLNCDCGVARHCYWHDSPFIN